MRNDRPALPIFESRKNDVFFFKQFPASMFEVAKVNRIIYVAKTIELVTSDLYLAVINFITHYCPLAFASSSSLALPSRGDSFISLAFALAFGCERRMNTRLI